jgi:hypothetical protein
MIALSSAEALVRTRIAVDQVRLSRLATQNAIERSRNSLADTRELLAALQRTYSSAMRQQMQERIDALDSPMRQAS